ncbi:hypothetical protein FCV25MIE_15620 [Fagus crenata]
MAAFREALSDYSLQDLGYRGLDFTWSNRRVDGALVRVRLDRYVANEDWLLFFPRAQVFHVVVVSSNHMGVLADLNPPQVTSIGRRKKMFRFEHMWARELGFEEAITEAWHTNFTGTPLFIVAQKIKQCKVHLLQWSQSQLRVTPRLIATKKARLVQLENCPMDAYNSSEVKNLGCEVNLLVEKEEIFWRQRSRVAWLKEGDRNTKFYHILKEER